MTRSRAVTRYAQQERAALCDTLLALGPDAPTLCDPWRARDLAAHLIIRESRPDLVAGQFVKPLQARLDRGIAQKAQQDFPKLVEQVRSGPPSWTPVAIAPIDEALNKMEFFIHHEDLLRAQPDATPRELDPDLEQAVWNALKSAGRLLYRRANVGVVLDADGVGRYVAKGPSPLGTVVVAGKVADLALYSYGRTSAAQVRLEGPEDAVASLSNMRLSI